MYFLNLHLIQFIFSVKNNYLVLDSTEIHLNHWILCWVDSSKLFTSSFLRACGNTFHKVTCNITRSAFPSLFPNPAFKDQMFQTDSKSVFCFVNYIFSGPKNLLEKTLNHHSCCMIITVYLV